MQVYRIDELVATDEISSVSVVPAGGRVHAAAF
jgi:hypothetical protein